HVRLPTVALRARWASDVGRVPLEPVWRSVQEGIVQLPSRQNHVRNPIGWRQRLARFQGSPVAFDLRVYDQEVSEINRLGRDAEHLSDREIEARARALREQAGGSRPPAPAAAPRA